jgi:histidyl-tRNA synthetase
MGVERVLDLISIGGFESLKQTDVYVVHAGSGALEMALQLGEQLRDQGFDAAVHAGGGSFKSQMKKADASGAAFAAIIGDDEVKATEITLKSLRNEQGEPTHGGEQHRVAFAEVADHLLASFGLEDVHDH